MSENTAKKWTMYCNLIAGVCYLGLFTVDAILLNKKES